MDQPRWRLDACGHLDEAGHIALGEPSQGDALNQALAREVGQDLGERMATRQLHVAVRPEHQDARPRELPREELEEEQRRRVRPVEVVQEHDQGLALGRVLQEVRGAVEEAEARLLRVPGDAHVEAGDHLAELREHLRDVGGAGAHLLRGLLGAAVVDVGARHLHPRPVGGGALALDGAPDQHARAAQARVGEELLGGARLADPGLPHEHEQPAAAGEGVLEARQEPLHLPLASDEDAPGISMGEWPTEFDD